MLRITLLSILLLKVTSASAQSMRLQDTPLGSVVQIGSFNYIKIAKNKYMQSTQVSCPDGATVGGKYVKCFESKTKYEEQCSEGSCACKYKSTEDGVPIYQCTIPKCADGTMDYIWNEEYHAYVCAKEFNYTGDVQTFTAPIDGTYKLEVWGAQGGMAGSSCTINGGYGGYSRGNISINKGQILSIVVGKMGGCTRNGDTQAGGYNGGGDCTSSSSSYPSGSGGGATHVALYNSKYNILSSYNTSTIAQQYVFIVAGGGGGSNYYTGSSYYGGMGGGVGGGRSTSSRSYAGGGSQSAGGVGDIQNSCSSSFCYGTTGSFGQGGLYNGDCGAGGGGGWYGGGGGRCGGGGGGSGYLNTSKLISGTYSMYCHNGSGNNTTTACSTGTNSTNGPNVSATAQANYAKSGNGYARITLISVD